MHKQGPLGYLSDVIQTGDLRAQTSMHTEELLVEESGQRQAVERIHTGIIHALRVLYFTCGTHTHARRGQTHLLISFYELTPRWTVSGGH